MTKRIALAAAGLLVLALGSTSALAASCAVGSTNCYGMKDSTGNGQSIAAVVLSDGRIVQVTTPVDQTGAPINPATAGAQTTGNNTLNSILAAQATAALQGAANTALGTPTDTAYAGSGSSSNIAALKGIYAQIASVLTQVTSANAANGAPSDTAYTGSGTASEIAALKGLYTQIGTLLTANGGVSDSAYAGTGSASQIAALKGLYAQLASLLAANGATGDAAYSGSGSASQVAALKGIYAQLVTIAGQAAPTSAVGTALTGSVPGFQGVGPSGVPLNVTGTVTTQSGTALVSPAYRIGVSAAGNNAQVFATGAKRMLHAYFCNKAASDRVLKFYDKASAPTPGTDAIVTSISAPAGSCPAIDFSSGGFPFANGLAVAVTLPGDSDIGSSVAAGDITGLNIQHN